MATETFQIFPQQKQFPPLYTSLVYKLLVNKYNLQIRLEQFPNYCSIDAASIVSDKRMIQITAQKIQSPDEEFHDSYCVFTHNNDLLVFVIYLIDPWWWLNTTETRRVVRKK
jgi:hypothetical protein